MKTSKGVFMNIDLNSVTFPFLIAVNAKEKVSEEDLYPFIDQYADTQITDVAINTFCQFSATPTKVMTDAVTRCTSTQLYGRTVSSEELQKVREALKSLYEIFVIHGIDPYDVWFRRIREKGLKSWMSIRMNDCHCPDEMDCWLHGDIFYEAIAKGWVIGDAYGYFRYALDYAVPEVRERMLAYLREQLFLYDVDGLELDYSREWYCFNTSDGKDHAAIMNGFMREVKAVVAEAEAKWGHRIEITARLMRDIEQNKILGFDAATWAAEKLVDSICVCARWATNDSDIPVDVWKKTFPEIAIYAAVTDLTYVRFAKREIISALCNQYLSQGADMAYLFNFFSNPLTPRPDVTAMYHTCGSLETLHDCEKRYVVTYQDTVPLGHKGWKPLPAKADGCKIGIPTGVVPTGKAVYVIAAVGCEISPEELSLSVNGQKATFVSETTFSTDYAGTITPYVAYDDATDAGHLKQYLFAVPSGACNDSRQELSFTATDDGLMIEYLELTVGMDVK